MGAVARKIETEVRRWISSGRFRPGDRLPSERELSQQFNASRTTVRLVLTRLSVKGLVEARHGKGYFIRVAPVPRPDLTPWKIHGERVVYDNPWVRLRLVDVQPPGAARFEHHVVHLARVAITVVLNDQDRVLMLWRYRFVPGRWAWELPGGIIEDGESGMEAAVRETWEETGWVPDSLQHILAFQPQIGMVDSLHELYLGIGATQIGAPQNGEETGMVAWIPLDEIPGMLARDELAGSGTLVALLHVLAFGKNIRKVASSVRFSPSG